MLLLEAGPDYPEPESLPADIRFGQAEGDVIPQGHLWDLHARFAPGRAPARLARGKIVGGSSAVNGQVFLRGLPDDFDAWVKAGAVGWDYGAMLHYFRLIETDLDFQDEWHGGDGPIPVRRYAENEWLPPQAAFHLACVDAGFPRTADANHPEATGVARIPFNNVGGIRYSAAVTHLAPARSRPNLTIAALAQVRRLQLDGPRVAAVEVVREGRTECMAANEVILAAGAVGSPHLLMLSGIGPANELSRLGIEARSDLTGVGRNLRDHQVVDLVWGGSPEAWRPEPRSPLLQVALTYSSGSQLRNDMKITLRSRVMERGRAAGGGALLTVVPGVYMPVGAGRLALVSADADVPPLIDFDFLTEDADIMRLRDGVQMGLELARHRALAEWTTVRLSPSDADLESDRRLDAWLRSSVRSSQHACGTCRMGAPDDPDTVVDPQGRVLGVDNLRIVDASVFPNTVRAHINATTVAVAERMADLVRRRR